MSHLSRHRTRILAGAVIAASGAVASASPMVIVQMLGKNVTKGQATFTNMDGTHVGDALAGPGDSIVYELLTYLAPVGTVNANIGTTTSITAGSDGINSLAFQAFELVSSSVQGDIKTTVPLTTNPYSPFNTTVPAQGVTLQNGWSGATGTSGGVLASRGNGNNDLITIRPAQGAGSFKAAFSTVATAVIGTGLFVVTSGGPNTVNMNLKWQVGGGGGSFKVNFASGGTEKFFNDTTETGGLGDPIVGYVPLGPVPEPGSLSLLGLAAAGLIARRKARQA